MSRRDTIDLTNEDEYEEISPREWAQLTSRVTQISPYNPVSSLNINLKGKRGSSEIKVGPSVAKRRRVNASPSTRAESIDVEAIGRYTSGADTAASRLHQRRLTSIRRSQSSTTRAGSSSNYRPTPTRPQVIELSDDDEPPPRHSVQSSARSFPLPLPSTSAPALMPESPREVIFHRLLTPVLFDKDIVQAAESVEDYDRIHAGLDLDNPDTWVPMEANIDKVSLRMERHENKASDSESESVSENAVEQLKLSRRQQFRRAVITSSATNKHQDTLANSDTMDDGPLHYCWQILPAARNLVHPRRFQMNGEGTRPKRDSLPSVLYLDKLKETTSFKLCPGSIIRIEQSCGWIAMAGASIGGMPDTPQADGSPLTVDPYNREGALTTYFHSRVGGHRIILGHQANRGRQVNHYGINDIKYCPVDNKTFVSSGNDHTVQVWRHVRPPKTDLKKDISSHRLGKFQGVPHALAFKPETTVLAVAAGNIFIFSTLEGRAAQPVELRHPRADQVVGNVCWGAQSTEQFLFSSTEPTETDVFVGWNGAFDVTNSKLAYKFDATEAGDAIFLDPMGASLAIATRRNNSNGILRLYDVKRQIGKAYAKIDLEPFEAGLEGEIHDASFSPDGLYLALGRHDNRTQVYDSRNLGRGSLYDFRHDDTALQVSPGYEQCGVTRLQWVQRDSRLGLVTSGSDGCVRLWDPLQAQRQKNGVVIAQVNSDIATFSLGDTEKREHQLVVGDCTGEVTIFDWFFDADAQRGELLVQEDDDN